MTAIAAATTAGMAIIMAITGAGKEIING